MGVGLFKWLFGGGVKQVGNVVEQVGGVFRPNAEKSAVRRADNYRSAQDMYAKEFKGEGFFNRFMDAVNRIPRPALALGTIALFVYAFRDPVGFAEVMAALDLVPTELWWMLSTITVFYFGGRELHKFRQTKPVKAVVENIEYIQRLRDHLTPNEAKDDDPDGASLNATELSDTDNDAVRDWQKAKVA